MNREFGSTIYKVQNSDGSITYTYTIARAGFEGHVSVSKPENGEAEVADVHSHGKQKSSFMTGNNKISKDDRIDSDRKGIDGYVVTPDGSLLKYDVKEKNQKDQRIKNDRTDKIPSQNDKNMEPYDRKTTTDPKETKVKFYDGYDNKVIETDDYDKHKK